MLGLDTHTRITSSVHAHITSGSHTKACVQGFGGSEDCDTSADQKSCSGAHSRPVTFAHRHIICPTGTHHASSTPTSAFAPPFCSTPSEEHLDHVPLSTIHPSFVLVKFLVDMQPGVESLWTTPTVGERGWTHLSICFVGGGLGDL